MLRMQEMAVAATMRSRSVALHVACAAMFVLIFANCRHASIEDRLERLPILPSDIASTLDPKTQATRLPTSNLVPVRDPAVVLSACCGSKDQKALEVRVSLTKCGKLRDFVVAPVHDLLLDPGNGGGSGGAGGAGVVAGAGSNTRMYRRATVNRTNVLDTIVCMTSDGPWAATFTEERNCNGYQPQDSLIVSGWGGLVGYSWNGGVSNHPPGIQLVSCREIGSFRFSCGGLSSCDCRSHPCPPGQTCPCTLAW